MHSILLNNQSFSYTILRKPIKSLRLKLVTNSSFQVICHRLTPSFLITNFIKNNTSWILKNATKIPAYPRLNLDSTISILNNKIAIRSITSNIEDIQYELKKKSLVLISDELEKLCLQFGFSYNGLSLKNQRSRFGSCSPKNNLNFNWQCIFFPYPVFRQLLLHELVHTKIKNHQSEFWAELTKCDPDTKKNNAWLKKFGARHFLFSP